MVVSCLTSKHTLTQGFGVFKRENSLCVSKISQAFAVSEWFSTLQAKRIFQGALHITDARLQPQGFWRNWTEGRMGAGGNVGLPEGLSKPC